jgi:hypothetical protein
MGRETKMPGKSVPDAVVPQNDLRQAYVRSDD